MKIVVSSMSAAFLSLAACGPAPNEASKTHEEKGAFESYTETQKETLDKAKSLRDEMEKVNEERLKDL
ncbi:hypothetical protein [Gilvimarinus xylanilyticus]|uniref:Uncharacterized protein n=1 Tax=Gilvimarinus xylanilyticus TaxID=2944139 RepID=A0A9X2HWH7_9GAMM|nr:hypothetical protein [Gilvimarinus xylanilyticus]MCP8898314.1 hypothetical protein [Gilvimarinus xylanilyticus]